MTLHALRVLWLLLAHGFRPAIRPTEPHVMGFRAWPWYCDENLHVNNAHYLTFMEYGRWTIALRAGMLRRAWAGRWTVLVAGISIVYRRPLPWWRRFTLRTRVIAARDPWFYLEQELVDARGQVASRAIVRATVRTRAGSLPIQEVLGGFDVPDISDPELLAFDEQQRQHLDRIKEAR
jgi:acyl-CoA thioesterase FadM